MAAARHSDVTAEWIARLPDDVRHRARPARLDLADVGSVEALASDVLAAGGVDILVNNSGGPPPGTTQDADVAAWTTQFATMAASLFRLTQLLLPPMLERGWGRIITIASSGVEQPIPRLALSNGVRSAIVGWSKTLANEVAARGITVNVVLPGRIETDRTAQIDAANAARDRLTVSEARRLSEATIPVGRYGTPEEFAAVVTFLAGEPASYVTGGRVRVDGGSIRSI